LDSQAFPVRYTPRRLSVNPDTRRLAIVESDHNAFSRAQLKCLAGGDGAAAAVPEVEEEKDEDEMEIEDDGAADAGAGAGAGGPSAVSVPPAGDESEEEEEAELEEGEETKKQFLRRVGPAFPGVPGVWGSCIRIFDPVTVRHAAITCFQCSLSGSS
jgi:hypothetical protein